MLLPALGLLAGVVGLYLGAHWLVFGAAGLGKTLGARPIVIGLTVVSLGTSAPELVVCVLAAIGGSSDLAIGNALGSNLANIGLILGVTAIVQPLGVNRRMVVREIPAMLLITLLVFPLIMDRDLSRSDGAILLIMLVVYLSLLLKSARRETPEILKDYEAHSDEIQAMPKSLGKNIFLVLLGSGLLVLGGRIIVVSAIHIATSMGIFRAAHRGDRGRDRHFAAGAGHLRGGGDTQRGGHRGRQRHRLQHLQPDRGARDRRRYRTALDRLRRARTRVPRDGRLVGPGVGRWRGRG